MEVLEVPLMAVEWDDTGVAWTTDGRTTRRSTGLHAVLAELDRPHAIVCWTSFYSCDNKQKAWLSESLQRRGHHLVGMSGRAAVVLAAAAGGESVAEPVEELFRLGLAGPAGLDYHVAAGSDWPGVRDAVALAHALVLGGGIAPDTEDARRVLGPLDSLDDDVRAVLGDGDAYSMQVLDAVSRAARVASGRPAYEGLLVLHAGPVTNELARTIRDRYIALVHPDGPVAGRSLTRSQYRRVLLRVYGALHRERMAPGMAA